MSRKSRPDQAKTGMPFVIPSGVLLPPFAPFVAIVNHLRSEGSNYQTPPARSAGTLCSRRSNYVIIIQSASRRTTTMYHVAKTTEDFTEGYAFGSGAQEACSGRHQRLIPTIPKWSGSGCHPHINQSAPCCVRWHLIQFVILGSSSIPENVHVPRTKQTWL